MIIMMVMTKRKEQVQNLIPRLDRNLSRSALTNDDEDGDDDAEGVYRQLVSLKLTTSSSNLQLHR